MTKLHEKTWLAISLVIFSYLLCLLLSDVTIKAFKMQTFLPVSLIFLFFLIILLMGFNIVLKVPNGKMPLMDYLRSIRLVNPNGWRDIIILSFLFTIIFSFSQLIGSIIYHLIIQEKYFIGLDKISFLDPHTIFLSIYEEIVWRGILLSLLLRRYSANNAIAISAILFGSFHLLNILNPEHDSIWYISQSFWAVGFGYLYGILFVRTNSLIPALAIHYLVNSLAGIWSTGFGKMDLVSAIYGIFFFGWIPVIICVIILDCWYTEKIDENYTPK